MNRSFDGFKKSGPDSGIGMRAEEIKKLPNNYAEAVTAREAWFLPKDLLDPKGSWVLLGDETRLPLALQPEIFSRAISHGMRARQIGSP